MEELVEVSFTYNDVLYNLKLSPTEIEEISSNSEKFNELGRRLENQQSQKESEENQGQSTDLGEPNASTSHSSFEKFKWSTNSIKLLLNIRFNLNSRFEAPKCKKNKLWMEIAKKMAELGDYSIHWEECYNKYRNSLQTYKSNREKRMKKSGESVITWEFYELFDSVLGNKASSYPPYDILCTSIDESSTENSSNQNDFDLRTEQETITDELHTENIQFKKLKTSHTVKNKISLPEYLYEKNKREQNTWQEKKLLKEKEIDAINNLAEAIRNTVRKQD